MPQVRSTSEKTRHEERIKEKERKAFMCEASDEINQLVWAKREDVRQKSKTNSTKYLMHWGRPEALNRKDWGWMVEALLYSKGNEVKPNALKYYVL